MWKWCKQFWPVAQVWWGRFPQRNSPLLKITTDPCLGGGWVLPTHRSLVLAASLALYVLCMKDIKWGSELPNYYITIFQYPEKREIYRSKVVQERQCYCDQVEPWHLMLVVALIGWSAEEIGVLLLAEPTMGNLALFLFRATTLVNVSGQIL